MPADYPAMALSQSHAYRLGRRMAVQKKGMACGATPLKSVRIIQIFKRRTKSETCARGHLLRVEQPRIFGPEILTRIIRRILHVADNRVVSGIGFP